jgi:selenide, water dikinase
MDIKLTQYSKGAGCGCKIAPAVLEEILHSQFAMPTDKLLVGNSSKDDAAVYDLGNGTALISTTDFFMPVVDDAFDFGRIASANAISDVYAMGGTPLMALAILGWPVDKIPAVYAQKVMEGSRNICAEAGIPLAGGHSIDAAEPIFGLAVSGIVPIQNLKRNSTARANDLIFLTKPLGTGVLSTAMKRGLLQPLHANLLTQQMTLLNKVGIALGNEVGVHAMTDVTGFGLLGHLFEMCEAANLCAEIYYNKLPVCEGVKEYIGQGAIPDATFRNWNNYSKHTGFDSAVNMSEAFSLLPDPQTNGGLLVSVSADSIDALKNIFTTHNLETYLTPIGKFVSSGEKTIFIRLNDSN